MRQEEPGLGGPLGPFAVRRKVEPCASSVRLGWVGLEAACYCETPAAELDRPALTHHRLILFGRPPEELDVLYEGVKRHVPPPAGSIMLMPAGGPHWVRTSGCKEELHFARQFKGATGLPPHQYVITRRVDRAKQLLRGGGEVSLAQVAARAGFSDQSVFSHHFKRLVGVTPGQFRTPARIG